MKQKPIFLTLVFVLLFAALALFSSDQAHAATLNVVTGVDTIDSNGQC